MGVVRRVTFKDYFSQVAAGYAAHRPVYPLELVQRLAALVRTPELAWDAGCGSGQLSRQLADRFQRVVATDASSAQIAAAPVHPRIEYRVERAEESGLLARSVDLCAAAQSAHWFDLDRYYAEVRRVSRPGGVIALVTYAWMSVGPEVDAVLAAFRHEIGPWWPPERQPVDELYGALAFPFDEAEVAPLDMVARWTVADLTGHLATWSSSQALVRAEGPERLEALLEPLREAWGEPASVRTVRWPLGMRVGRV